ncbi:hypothetical protein V8B97DRAFT_1865198 [Scleroderma yunnanense]
MDEEVLWQYTQRSRQWRLVLCGTFTEDGRMRTVPRTIGRREWQGSRGRRAPPIVGSAVPSRHQPGVEGAEEIPTVVVTRSAADPTDVIGPDNTQTEETEPDVMRTQPSVTELEYGSLERRPTTSTELLGSGDARAIEIRRSDPPEMAEGGYGSLRRQPTGRRLRTRRQPTVTTGSVGRSESREGEVMTRNGYEGLERRPTLGGRLRRFLRV